MVSHTFGAWIAGQVHRQDEVGEIARFWLNLKGTRKINAVASIERELENEGALAQGAPTAAWWEQAKAEYHESRSAPTTISGRPPLAAVPPLPTEPQTVPGQHRQVPLEQADRIEAKLDWLHAWVELAMGEETMGAAQRDGLLPPWPGGPEPAPVGWQAIFDAADFDAAEKEAGA